MTDTPQPASERRRARLLLVDRNVERRGGLAESLRRSGYELVLSCDDEDAIVHVPSAMPDLILVDLDAPTCTSEHIAALGAAAAAPPVPLLGLTSDATLEGRVRAARAGVNDVAFRPVDFEELRLRIDLALSQARVRRLEMERLEVAWDQNIRRSDEEVVRESLAVLAAIGDYHDDDTHQHAERVGATSARIAAAIGLSETFIEMIRDAAPLHDIGKVGISRRILLKPEKLTPSEWLHMTSHVEIGEQMLADTAAPVFRLAAEIARTHHERWDGTGYTAGLRGKEIPLSGRIVAVADVWDTLTHQRPYRAAWAPEKARAEIQEQSGAQFDPAVVEAFLGLGSAELPLGGDVDQPAAV